MRHAAAFLRTINASDRPDERDDCVDVVVVDGDDRHTLRVDRGRTLRDALIDADYSPYAPATKRLNCGGRGLCATCGVRVRGGPAAEHWHDRLAERFGYPRLSCQIVVEEPMTVSLVDKRVWGGRERRDDEDACDDDVDACDDDVDAYDDDVDAYDDDVDACNDDDR